jgi:serine/threonine-protein phosphatase 2B regulatory subunit
MGAHFSAKGEDGTIEFASKECYSKWSIANVEAAWQRFLALDGDGAPPRREINAMDFRTVFSDFETIVGKSFLCLPGSEFDLLKTSNRKVIVLEVFALLCVLADGSRADTIEDRVELLLHVYDSDHNASFSEDELLVLWSSLISVFEKVGAIEKGGEHGIVQEDIRKLAQWLIVSSDEDKDGTVTKPELSQWCGAGGGKRIGEVVTLLLTKDRAKILARKKAKQQKDSKGGSPRKGGPPTRPGTPSQRVGHGDGGRGGPGKSGQRGAKSDACVSSAMALPSLEQTRADALAAKVKEYEMLEGRPPGKLALGGFYREVAQEEREHLELVLPAADINQLAQSTLLDVSELMRLRMSFSLMANHHGQLTRPILFRVLKHRFPQIDACGRETVKRCGELIDADHDGTVDFREFVRTLSMMRKGTIVERVAFLFKLYDVDGDQQMSAVELFTLLASGAAQQSTSMALSDTMLQVPTSLPISPLLCLVPETSLTVPQLMGCSSVRAATATDWTPLSDTCHRASHICRRRAAGPGRRRQRVNHRKGVRGNARGRARAHAVLLGHAAAARPALPAGLHRDTGRGEAAG